MKKREAAFQTLFRHWVRSKPSLPTGAYELKQTTTDSIPFSDVQLHQLAALEAAQSGTGILYKIPDDSRGVKPFDMVYLQSSTAWIVIRFPKFFCVISLESFEIEKSRSERKSLTSDRARAVSTWCTDL